MDIAGILPGIRVIEMHHPASEATLVGIRVTLRSIEDEKLKRLKREFQDEYLKLQQRNKVQKAEQIETNADRLLMEAIESWEWYNPTGNPGDEGYDPEQTPTLEGQEKPEMNHKNLRSFVKIWWVRKQLNEEMDDVKAFFDE